LRVHPPDVAEEPVGEGWSSEITNDWLAPDFR
jgi:hypothetical protein